MRVKLTGGKNCVNGALNSPTIMLLLKIQRGLGFVETKATENEGRLTAAAAADGVPSHFIRTIITEDLKQGKNQGRVHTRFPPEPNGYLHIGHAKSICLNFGLAAEFSGLCNLRFDDTNPSKEDVEYVESIKRDVRWLGFDWQDREFYASDYFEDLYQFAIQLIKAGKAFVCDLSADQMREYRGTLTEPGRNSPFRDRSIEENLDLFQLMRAGEFLPASAIWDRPNRRPMVVAPAGVLCVCSRPCT
jgi:glutaminyl-tRNA synthetase